MLRKAVFTGLAVIAGALVTARPYDLDGDGWPDSISLLGTDLHLVVTQDEPRRAGAVPFKDGRLYHVPAGYLHALVNKTFDWDSRWATTRSDAKARVTEAVRLEDNARVLVHVDDWRGWGRIRVAVLGGPSSEREVAAAVFQCLESIVFYGMATPRTVRAFNPP